MPDREAAVTRRNLIFLATLGSAGLLGGAFLFGALGYAPCKLCIWQRWPHGIAIALGVVALTGAASRGFAWAGAAAALATAGLGAYHVGVEQRWWPGPSSCSGSGAERLGAMPAEDLLSFDFASAVVMCDEIAWQFLGLSMAGWNALLSLALAGIWVAAARRRAVPQPA